MAEIRALVLDFGQVISRSIFELAPYVERGFGLAPGAFPWRGPLAIETDPLWAEMLAGTFSEREYWTRRLVAFAPLIGRDVDMSEFNAAACAEAGSEWYRPEIDALVDDARAAGLKTGVLTNELELFHGREFVERVPILARIDAVVDATHTNILKPDPRAYAAIADALDVDPAEVLFVDDQPHNVSGARAAGMRAVHFRIQDVPGSVADIRAALPALHSAARRESRSEVRR